MQNNIDDAIRRLKFAALQVALLAVADPKQDYYNWYTDPAKRAMMNLDQATQEVRGLVEYAEKRMSEAQSRRWEVEEQLKELTKTKRKPKAGSHA